MIGKLLIAFLILTSASVAAQQNYPALSRQDTVSVYSSFPLIDRGVVVDLKDSVTIVRTDSITQYYKSNFGETSFYDVVNGVDSLTSSTRTDFHSMIAKRNSGSKALCWDTVSSCHPRSVDLDSFERQNIYRGIDFLDSVKMDLVDSLSFTDYVVLRFHLPQRPDVTFPDSIHITFSNRLPLSYVSLSRGMELKRNRRVEKFELIYPAEVIEGMNVARRVMWLELRYKPSAPQAVIEQGERSLAEYLLTTSLP